MAILRRLPAIVNLFLQNVLLHRAALLRHARRTVPSIYDLKPGFQKLLRPFVAALARAGIRANHVTIIAVLLSCAAGAAIALRPEARWPLLVIPAVLFVRMALNAIDGMLAREHNMKTNLGAVLNELGDVVSDTSMYLPFAVVPGLDARVVVAVVILAILTEMAGVVTAMISGERRYDGPMGKSDRAFVFGALALGLGLEVLNPTSVNGVLTFAALLLVITLLNRARHAAKEPR